MSTSKSSQWMVTVTISGNSRLGVDADWSDGKTLYIKAILAGAVSNWNKENPTKSVQPGDRVISVNGVSGDAQAMVREIKDRSLLQLLFQKGEEKERPADPEPVPVPGVVRAGMPIDIPGMPPRTVDVLLELRARAAEKAAAAKGTTPKPVAKPSNEPPNHYEVLGIDLKADDTAIKKSYRKLVLQWHPDKHPTGREEADVKIRQINLAYETISNPLKRQSYDQMLQALERRRLNIRLETQFIKPRMSIPKEFMLCPLGYADKFVRIVGDQLLVQSRDEALGVGFQDFFQAAKFSLWWLPEVNNMCRLRARETAGQGMEGGTNVSFQFKTGQEEDDAAETDCQLSDDQEMKRCNLIVSASPFSQGAFRFEAAFWPGRFMAFRPTDQLRMAGKVDEGGDVADFVLVDFSAAYKYMTTSEVLKGAVESQGGGQGGFVKLSDLRADLSVRMYFQQMLGSSVWNNKDFETFFEGHYEEWDFDAKKSRVRMRPDGPLLRQAAAPMPPVSNGTGEPSPVAMDVESSGLAEKLSNSPSQAATVKLLLEANGEDLARLRHGAAVAVLSRLAEKASNLATDKMKDLTAARRRFLITLPVLLGEGVFSKRDKRREAELPMSTLLGMQKDVAAIDKADTDRELVSACQGAVESISELIGGRVKHEPDEVSLEVLPELLALPLNWRAVAEPMADALGPLLKHQKPGVLLQPLRAAAKLPKSARPVVEVLASVEMRGIAYADGAVAAEVLLALAENNLEIAAVASKLRPPLLQRLPLPDLVSIVAALGEQGLKDDLLRPPLQARVAVAGPGLAAVPSARLLRLATAATRSACIAECALGPVAGAAAQSLENWTAEDVAELMLVVATSSSGPANSPGAKRLFSRVTEVLTPRLSALSASVLLKVVVAAGAAAAHCRSLLEAAANKAVLKGGEMKPEQVMLLTQGVLPLGGSHQVVIRLLNFWAQLLAGSDKAPVLPADDVAQLAMLLSMVSPDHGLVFHVLGLRLQEGVADLTEAGFASLEAAFPGGAGPSFSGKEELLSKVAERKAKAAEAAAEAEASKSKATLVPRRDRSRSRTRSRRPSRSRRSRSRSRRR